MLLVLEEKNRQIELIQKTEAERAQITNSLKEMFLEERANATAEMHDFLKAF